MKGSVALAVIRSILMSPRVRSRLGPLIVVLLLSLFPLRAQPPVPPAADTAADSRVNTATIPVSKLENDSYDWFKRHEAVLALQPTLDPEIVLIGDSITHFWAGEPRAHRQNGSRAWAETFGARRVLNMGFGWDRTQNVLWRLEHGELDGTRPQAVVLNVGTNNFSATRQARANSPEEIAQGIEAICAAVRAKCPTCRIIVMGVFPRGSSPTDERRAGILALNAILAKRLAGRANLTFLDIGPRLLQPDGRTAREVMPDGTHPDEKGYAIWGEALTQVGAWR